MTPSSAIEKDNYAKIDVENERAAIAQTDTADSREVCERENKKYVFIARGSSHIKYFNAFAQQTSLDVQVIKINKHPFLPSHLMGLKQVKNIDIDKLLEAYLAKKASKYNAISHTFLWAFYRHAMRTILKLDIVKSMSLIRNANADVVGVWNGQKLPSSSIAEAAKALGKEVVYFENGLLPNSTTCDWSGVNCKNSLPKSGEFYRKYYSEAPLPNKLISRKPIAKKTSGAREHSLPEQYIFVPFQVETDSQIISNSPWIKTMRQLFEYLVTAIEKVNNPHLHIVIKEHPSEKKRHDVLHGIHPRIVFANEWETQKLIEKSQAVLTINSTVGIESLLLNKPVLTMGNACYGLDGVSLPIRSEGSLLEALNQLERCQGNPEITKGFLHFLNEHYAIPTAWNNMDERHVEALNKRLTKQDLLSKIASA